MRLGLLFIVASLLTSPAYAGFDDPSELAIYTIMGEASNQPYEGQLAVAEVIRNRAKAYNAQYLDCLVVLGWDTCFESSVKEVVLQPWQFSFWNSKKKAKQWLEKYGTGEAYQTASRAWAESEHSNIVKGADLYHASYVKPRWNFGKTIFIRQLGAHRFYKEVH